MVSVAQIPVCVILKAPALSLEAKQTYSVFSYVFDASSHPVSPFRHRQIHETLCDEDIFDIFNLPAVMCGEDDTQAAQGSTLDGFKPKSLTVTVYKFNSLREFWRPQRV